jgi:hypothetical protein
MPGRTVLDENKTVFVLSATDTADLLEEDFGAEKYNHIKPLYKTSRYRIDTNSLVYKVAIPTDKNNEYNVQMAFAIDEISENLQIQRHRNEYFTFTARLENGTYIVVQNNVLKNTIATVLAAIATGLAYAIYATLRN